MPGSLNDLLPQPISPENEEVILDLLKRKMTVSLDLAVQLLNAIEKRFGPEVAKSSGKWRWSRNSHLKRK